MAWNNQGRTLPSNWSSLRKKVFRRDGDRCTWRNVYGDRCKAPAEECDHIGRNDDHSMSNLRSLCHHHHSLHTAAQSAASRARRRKEVSKKFRRTEAHPGLL